MSSCQKSAGATLLADKFANPPLAARPQIRLWLPGAAVSDAGLQGDIDTIARLGFGGVEIDAFPVPTVVKGDFQWGSQAWNHLTRTAAEQADRAHITVDFTNGANGPIALPGVRSADDLAALYELTYGSTIIGPGETYSGIVPRRRRVRAEGRTKLEAVLAFRLLPNKILDLSSEVNLTAKTRIDAADNPNSTISFTPPQVPPHGRSSRFGSNPPRRRLELTTSSITSVSQERRQVETTGKESPFHSSEKGFGLYGLSFATHLSMKWH